eukprot:1126887-Amphidinium_carterae.1
MIDEIHTLVGAGGGGDGGGGSTPIAQPKDLIGPILEGWCCIGSCNLEPFSFTPCQYSAEDDQSLFAAFACHVKLRASTLQLNISMGQDWFRFTGFRRHADSCSTYLKSIHQRFDVLERQHWDSKSLPVQ